MASDLKDDSTIATEHTTWPATPVQRIQRNLDAVATRLVGGDWRETLALVQACYPDLRALEISNADLLAALRHTQAILHGYTCQQEADCVEACESARAAIAQAREVAS